MKFGWAIWNLAGCSQAEKCRLAGGLGLDFVSFNTSPKAWAAKHPGEEAATPALLRELGLGWTVHAGLPATADHGAFAFLDEIAGFAAEAGAPLAVSFDPVCSGEKPDRRYEPEITLRSLERAFAGLEALGTRLALENSPRNCEPELFVPVVKRLPATGMLLDTGHLNMHIAGDASRIAGYLDALPLPILDLHLHDNDGEHDQHLALGDGRLPFRELFAALRERGYDGLATVEVCPGLESLRFGDAAGFDALRRTLTLARRGLGG